MKKALSIALVITVLAVCMLGAMSVQAANDFTLSLSSGYASSDNTFVLTGVLKGTPSVNGVQFKVNLGDDGATVISGLVSDKEDGASAIETNFADGIFTYSMAAAQVTDAYKDGVKVFELKVKASDISKIVPVLGEYEISSMSATDLTPTMYTLGLDTTGVKLEKPDTVLYGDVNGDGKVNPTDRAILSRYLAGWANYGPGLKFNVVIENADVNADGMIKPNDRAILSRHLAGWEGYATLPYGK